MNEPAANHPPTCRGCHGTGYQTVVVTCTHHWTNDDPHTTDPVPFERGIQIARAAYTAAGHNNPQHFDHWL